MAGGSLLAVYVVGGVFIIVGEDIGIEEVDEFLKRISFIFVTTSIKFLDANDDFDPFSARF